MTEGSDAPPPTSVRRRTDVFGEVVPVQSGDERAETWGDVVEDSEEALRREVPPHHS
jgi:hypothetical protein